MKTFDEYQAYELYRKKLLFYTKNIKHVRKMENFDNAKEKPSWPYFELFAKIVQQNNGAINPEIFLDAVFEHYDRGYVDPKILGSQKAIKIYKLYTDSKKHNRSKADIESAILKSMGFVVKYCLENNVANVGEYLSKDLQFPIALRHLQAGSICGEFLSLLPGFKYLLAISYPPDLVADVCPTLKDDLKKFRHNSIMIPRIANIADNFQQTVDKIILTKKSATKEL
jgi:hypothetical protein